MIGRRAIPLVVAFALAFGPVALEACHASCQPRALETATSGSADHHHAQPTAQAPAMPAGDVHHHTTGAQPPPSGAVRAAQPPPCDHGNGLPAFSLAWQNTLVTPAVVAAAFQFPEPELRRAHVRGPGTRVKKE